MNNSRNLVLPIYLDHNATTPCHPEVVSAMMPYFMDDFGNAASRDHSFGWHAAEAVKIAREQVARLIGATETEIIFTSGATEACNLAIKGVFETYASKGRHVITCTTEHPAVLDSCRHLEKMGAEVTLLPVDGSGRISLTELEASIRPDTILVALMYANNETGTVHPIKEIGALAKKHQVLFFSDATQAVGKIPVNVQEENIDLLALSAHKFYGPKGAGALFVRRRDPRVRLTAQMDGGGHERGFRSGTLNVPGIVGLGRAAEICGSHMEQEGKRLSALRDLLENGLLQLPGILINGDRENRLPHVTNICFVQADGEGMLMGINKEIAVSTGSACSSASPEPSHVLKAMGLDDERAHSSLRFALGRTTTEEEIAYTIQKVSASVRQLRALNPLKDAGEQH